MENLAHVWGLQELFPASVAMEATDAHGKLEDLYPEERKLLSNAIARRQGEFAAGRICARKALERLGIKEYPILIGERGVPLWPEGVVGSISHAQGCYGTVIARKSMVEAIGFDVEISNRLHSRLWKMALKPAEKMWLNKTLLPYQQIQWATLFFSAKEAFYKFQYSLTGQWLGFQNVEVRLNEKPSHHGSFTVFVEKDRYPIVHTIVGKYVFFGRYVATGIIK